MKHTCRILKNYSTLQFYKIVPRAIKQNTAMLPCFDLSSLSSCWISWAKQHKVTMYRGKSSPCVQLLLPHFSGNFLCFHINRTATSVLQSIINCEWGFWLIKLLYAGNDSAPVFYYGPHDIALGELQLLQNLCWVWVCMCRKGQNE